MMRAINAFHLSMVSCAVLAWANGAALAGPLEVNRLPADTAWVIHVDLEQVRGSAIGQYILSDESGLNLDEMRDDMKEEIGFDLLKEGMDVTLQGPRDDDKGGVIVLTTTAVVDDSLAWIKEHGTSYEMMEIDGYQLHTWREEVDDEQLYLQMKTIGADRRQVALSPSLPRLLLTLKTMSNNAPSVTQTKESPLAIAPPIGSLVYFQTTNLMCVPEVDLDERIANAAGRVTFSISEHSDLSRVELACTAEDETQAKTVSEVLQGAVALGKLFTSSDDDMRELNHMLSQMQSKAVGNEIALRLEMPSDELRKLTQDD